MSQLTNVQERIAALEEKKGKALEYLSELNAQLGEMNQELADLQLQYADQQILLDSVQQDLSDARAEEEKQREDMGVRIQYMYENSTDAGLLEAVFSAESFTDFLNRAQNFSSLTDFDREMLAEYRRIFDDVKMKKSAVMAQKKEVAMLAAQTEEKLAEISELYDATADDVAAYTEELTKNQDEQNAIISELNRRENEIRILTDKISQEIAAAEARARAEAAQAAAEEAAQSPDAEQSESGSSEGEASSGGAEDASSESTETAQTTSQSSSSGSGWSGSKLTRSGGVNNGPNGKETYYNLNMSGVVKIMRNMGVVGEYWVRSDGVKMYGDYVMVAANLNVHPRGSLVESSLGTAIVCDTGGFATSNPNQLDIAVSW